MKGEDIVEEGRDVFLWSRMIVNTSGGIVRDRFTRASLRGREK